jgi:hypothetical protein
LVEASIIATLKPGGPVDASPQGFSQEYNNIRNAKRKIFFFII